MAADYDESHNYRPRNVFEEHMFLPFKRTVTALRERINDINQRVHSPIFLDQHPGKSFPAKHSKLYNFSFVAPRRNGEVGFDGLASVVDLGAFILPRNNNLVIPQDGAFYWVSTNIVGFMSLTYDSNPGFGGNTFVNPLPVADIFDAAIEQNGGAIQMNYFFGNVPGTADPGGSEPRAHICFDLELYDRKRGKRLHEEHLPPQLLCAQGYDNKMTSKPMRFPPNTEIEPRLRLLEVRPGSILNTTQAFEAAQFRGYINIIFNGFRILDV